LLREGLVAHFRQQVPDEVVSNLFAETLARRLSPREAVSQLLQRMNT
jgi:hypothetical protein